jgi:hypothetical protein
LGSKVHSHCLPPPYLRLVVKYYSSTIAYYHIKILLWIHHAWEEAELYGETKLTISTPPPQPPSPHLLNKN